MVAGCATTTGLAGFATATIEVGDQPLTVLLAETSTQRRQGLREVPSLPVGIDGMLFVWDAPTTATFGMLDTMMPLDIWWFDGDGILLGSTRMEPCPAEPCAGHGSPGPIRWALETPAGEFELETGARLSTVEIP